MLKIQFTPEFKDDYTAATQRVLNVYQFQETVTYLINGLTLPDRFNPRPYDPANPSGDLRTCRVEPNWRLVYRTTPTTVILRSLKSDT